MEREVKEENDGWTTVRRRRRAMKQRTDAYSDNRWRKNQGEEVTCFFSEFPENFGAKEMFRAFEKYGKVVDVVIPAKRDKLGRRFGFARFVGVSDVKLFGIKLDNIIIGATKIFVNTPRFERELTFGRDRQQQNLRETNTHAKKYGGGYQQYQWKEKKRVGEQKKEGDEEVRRDTGTERRDVFRKDVRQQHLTETKAQVRKYGGGYKQYQWKEKKREGEEGILRDTRYEKQPVEAVEAVNERKKISITNDQEENQEAQINAQASGMKAEGRGSRNHQWSRKYRKKTNIWRPAKWWGHREFEVEERRDGGKMQKHVRRKGNSPG